MGLALVARLGDAVGSHGGGNFWGGVGAIAAGVAIGALLVLAAPAVAAGTLAMAVAAACVGGAMLSVGMTSAFHLAKSFASESKTSISGNPCSEIVQSATKTIVEGIKVAIVGNLNNHNVSQTTQGSGSVMVEGKPLCRIGDACSCGGRILLTGATAKRTWAGGNPRGPAPKEADPTWVGDLERAGAVFGMAALGLIGVAIMAPVAAAGFGAVVVIGAGVAGTMAVGKASEMFMGGVHQLGGDRAVWATQLGGSLLGSGMMARAGQTMGGRTAAPAAEAEVAAAEAKVAAKAEITAPTAAEAAEAGGLKAVAKEQFGEGASSRVYREGDTVRKVVKNEVAADGGNVARISDAERDFIAKNTVELTNQVHEAVPSVPQMRSPRPGEIEQPFVEGKQLWELKGPADRAARANMKDAIAQAHESLGLESGAVGDFPNGFMVKVDPNSANFRFDQGGNITSWFDPVSIVPPGSRALPGG